MQTIHKYFLTGSSDKLSLPDGAEFLHVGEQQGTVCAWFRVDTSKPIVPRSFSIYGTGFQLPDSPGLKYRGTVQMTTGLVLHVFEDEGVEHGVYS